MLSSKRQDKECSESINTALQKIVDRSTNLIVESLEWGLAVLAASIGIGQVELGAGATMTVVEKGATMAIKQVTAIGKKQAAAAFMELAKETGSGNNLDALIQERSDYLIAMSKLKTDIGVAVLVDGNPMEGCDQDTHCI
jgi:hypothetical protein